MTAFAPLVPAATAGLDPFVSAGVFGPTEIQVAATVARLEPGLHPDVLLALAVAARAPRLGHVGIELAEVAHRMLDRHQEDLPTLPWPEPKAWARTLAASPAVATPDTWDHRPVRPLVWDGTRIYLQRYFAYELAVADQLRARAEAAAAPPGEGTGAVLDALFPPRDGPGGPDLQRRAAESALGHPLAVIAGGPGTGKTRTIARLVAASHQLARAEGRSFSVALAAPTGKAAARMTEAVHQAVVDAEAEGAVEPWLAEVLRSAEATTIHRLLGWRPGGRFRHDHRDPLVHDLVVVDETSMVSLPLMARLLDAVRPQARVVLVGDPNQLASVEAGTVLGDVVGPAGAPTPVGQLPLAPVVDGPLAGRVTVLRRVHRFGAGSGIEALADAIRDGHVDEAIDLLRGSAADLTWVALDDASAMAALEDVVVGTAAEVVEAARAGDAERGLDAATRVKVLAATRLGANGLIDWTTRIERSLADRVPLYDGNRGRAWHVGRPVLVTMNDRINKVANGDIGLTVAGADGAPMVVALPDPGGVRYLAPARLREVETWWAMTIHKSQGSEFPHVVVALPHRESPILTRELLYTAATRARTHLTVVADEGALRTAVGRPVARASGLGPRLWSS